MFNEGLFVPKIRLTHSLGIKCANRSRRVFDVIG